VERISSRQNAMVKRFRELRAGRIDEQVLLDGAHLLEEALSSGVEIEAAAFSDRLVRTTLAPLAARTEASGIRTLVIPPQVLSAISPVRQPSGVCAIGRVRAASLDGALSGALPLVVILHEVQDPGNVGATIRAADACGATGLVTTAGTADPLGWKALRASMGSAFRVTIAAKVPVAEIEAALKTRKIPLFATVPRDGTPLPDADLTGPAAILAGSEGAGIPADLVARSAALLTIPMRPPVESLNVSIAASLILYEAARQRRT
jgi:TrmH family RNA methyltransferase